MKAIEVMEFGGPDVLRLADRSEPELRPHDLLVQVHAAGVNRADLTFRKGVYGRVNFGDSDGIGLEVAGVVRAVGEMVSHFAVGDRVMGIVGGGAYAELARIDADMAMPMPSSLSFVEAAAIPEAFVTAHEALAHLGQLKPHETALIHAAASGVGTAAVQIAKRIGASVIATVSAGKTDRVLELGADRAVAYDTRDFATTISGISRARGVDVILDFIGAPNFERNIRLLRDGGRLIQVGLMAGLESSTLPLAELVHRNLQVIGTIMKSRNTGEKAAMVKRFQERWLSDIAAQSLRPVIDSTFPLEQASDAHRRMESHLGVGKIVLTIDGVA